MANGKLLTSFTLDATNNQIRITDGSTPATITIPAATYYLDHDGGADDFWTVLKAQIDAAYSGTIAIVQNGVTGSEDSTKAQGRVKYTASGSPQITAFLWGNANVADTELDPRILGFGAAPGTKSFSGSVLWSEYVTRYAWFPQTNAQNAMIRQQSDRVIKLSSGRYPEGADWGEFQAGEILFDWRESALVRIDAGATSSRATAVLTTVSDPNIAYERWALDAGADVTKVFRYYPDLGVTDTFRGPFTFPEGDVYDGDPLAPCSVLDPISELWLVVVPVIEAP